jgi:hypothetical protein
VGGNTYNYKQNKIYYGINKIVRVEICHQENEWGENPTG